MENSKEELVLTLKTRIQRIIELYENQKKINITLENSNKGLNEKLILLENKVRDIEEKYDNLRLAKAIATPDGEGGHEARIKVNRIVREIDKCIALLNR